MMALGFSTALVFLFAFVVSFVSTQNTSDTAAILQQLQENLPKCALACVSTEVPKSTCEFTDIGCICTNKPLNDAIAICMATGCTVVEQLQSQKFVSTACGAEVRNISTQLVVATWPLYSLAVIAVIIRLAGRLQALGGKQSWDDYIMVLCILTHTVLAALAQELTETGLGQDIWMLTPKQIQDTLFYFWIGQFMYCFLVAITKISILALYLRIFTTPVFKWQCYGLITFTALYGAAAIIATGLLCNPIDGVWKGWDGQHPSKCVNINALTFAVAGINMVLDILIIVLPVYQLWSLQMHTKKKLAVSSMFLVGIFVTICSGIRLGTILKFQKSTNPTYDYTKLSVWSLIEASAGIICACMPGMANAIRRFWPKFLSTHARTSRGTSAHLDTHKTGSKYGRVSSPKGIHSKTTVSITYADRSTISKDNNSARSDELELTPPTAYKQHESHTRYSEESGRETISHEDRKYGFHG